MNIIELDTFRAEYMRALLDATGRGEIWKYDIITTRQAFSEACYNQNYDSIRVDGEAIKAGKLYALVGYGIEDCPFSTVEELTAILNWLCRDGGYLSCYSGVLA